MEVYGGVIVKIHAFLTTYSPLYHNGGEQSMAWPSNFTYWTGCWLVPRVWMQNLKIYEHIYYIYNVTTFILKVNNLKSKS
jgi:hypothetical protein